jgi:hypothetical protein
MNQYRIKQEIQQTVDRFREMSKPVQIAFFIALGLILILGWDQFVRPQIANYNAQARSYQQRIESLRNAELLALQINSLRDTIVAVGDVRLPRTPAEGEQAMQNAVIEVTQRYSAMNVSFNMRSGGSLPRGALDQITGGVQPERKNGTLRFEAPTDDAIAIIAALESRPEIESITSLRLTKSTSRRLSVVLSLEAWLLPQDQTIRSAGETAEATGI